LPNWEDSRDAWPSTQVCDYLDARTRGAVATAQHLLHGSLCHGAAGANALARASPPAVAECHHRPAGRLPGQHGETVAAALADHGRLARCAPGGHPAHLHAAAADPDCGLGLQCPAAVWQALAALVGREARPGGGGTGDCRDHCAEHDPALVADRQDKAVPVLDLYAHAPVLQAQGELIVCADEKTSIQARQRVSPTQGAAPGKVLQVADRYKRMGTLQLFCALVVASGLTFTQTRTTKKFVDFKAFLLAFFQSALCAGIKVLHLILDNGPTHAPKQLSTWLASLELAFEVHIYWLPTHASWLDQVEIIFSKVQRDLLTPNDFPSLVALERDLAAYFAELNTHPKPIKWTYTKTKLLAKFEAPPLQLAA
jgi:DDE superfamily endonuclease